MKRMLSLFVSFVLFASTPLVISAEEVWDTSNIVFQNEYSVDEIDGNYTHFDEYGIQLFIPAGLSIDNSENDYLKICTDDGTVVSYVSNLFTPGISDCDSLSYEADQFPAGCELEVISVNGQDCVHFENEQCMGIALPISTQRWCLITTEEALNDEVQEWQYIIMDSAKKIEQ